ncbi:MAG TPA: EamA family transporter [Patescibacteria group bacterium]
MWQLFLIISIIANSFSTVLQKVLLKNNKSDPITYAIVFEFLCAIAIGIYAFFEGFILPKDIITLLPNILLATILYSAGNIFLFKSLKLIDASEFTVLFVTRGIWIIITAVLFLHERFSYMQDAGTALVLLGVILVTIRKHAIQMNRGVWYGLLSAFFFGVAFPNDGYVVTHFTHPVTYSFIIFILPALALMAVYPKKTIAIPNMMNKALLVRIIILSIIYAIFGVTILLAYKYGGDASQIGAISQISTIITVLLSIIFLKETSDLWKKVIGALLGFLGVILIK